MIFLVFTSANILRVIANCCSFVFQSSYESLYKLNDICQIRVSHQQDTFDQTLVKAEYKRIAGKTYDAREQWYPKRCTWTQRNRNADTAVSSIRMFDCAKCDRQRLYMQRVVDSQRQKQNKQRESVDTGTVRSYYLVATSTGITNRQTKHSSDSGALYQSTSSHHRFPYLSGDGLKY